VLQLLYGDYIFMHIKKNDTICENISVALSPFNVMPLCNDADDDDDDYFDDEERKLFMNESVTCMLFLFKKMM
jgi:hypothetical protein